MPSLDSFSPNNDFVVEANRIAVDTILDRAIEFNVSLSREQLATLARFPEGWGVGLSKAKGALRFAGGLMALELDDRESNANTRDATDSGARVERLAWAVGYCEAALELSQPLSSLTDLTLQPGPPVKGLPLHVIYRNEVLQTANEYLNQFEQLATALEVATSDAQRFFAANAGQDGLEPALLEKVNQGREQAIDEVTTFARLSKQVASETRAASAAELHADLSHTNPLTNQGFSGSKKPVGVHRFHATTIANRLSKNLENLGYSSTRILDLSDKFNIAGEAIELVHNPQMLVRGYMDARKYVEAATFAIGRSFSVFNEPDLLADRTSLRRDMVEMQQTLNSDVPLSDEQLARNGDTALDFYEQLIFVSANQLAIAISKDPESDMRIPRHHLLVVVQPHRAAARASTVALERLSPPPTVAPTAIGPKGPKPNGPTPDGPSIS